MAQKINATQILTLPASNLDNTTLTSGKKATIIYGWGYVTATGATSALKSYNFGVTFASAPSVVCQTAGYKAGSNPTSLGDIQGVAGEMVRGGQAVTTTGFQVFCQNTGGTAIASGTRIVFNVIIIGELA